MPIERCLDEDGGELPAWMCGQLTVTAPTVPAPQEMFVAPIPVAPLIGVVNPVGGGIAPTETTPAGPAESPLERYERARTIPPPDTPPRPPASALGRLGRFFLGPLAGLLDVLWPSPLGDSDLGLEGPFDDPARVPVGDRPGQLTVSAPRPVGDVVDVPTITVTAPRYQPPSYPTPFELVPAVSPFYDPTPERVAPRAEPGISTRPGTVTAPVEVAVPTPFAVPLPLDVPVASPVRTPTPVSAPPEPVLFNPFPIPTPTPRTAPRTPLPFAAPLLGSPLDLLTPFNTPRVDSPQQADRCKCPKQEKKPKRKREPRSVCYKGTYIETGRSLKKFRREQIPCQ